MARQIFLVTPYVVDSNGTFSIMPDYPKSFDSRNYQNDIAKAQKRAEGEFAEVKGAMCKRDDRMIQTVILETVDGFQIDRWTDGNFSEPAE